jgi:glutathione synthase/RimK-type ligase-like ATP-grasp enzyme
MDNTRYKIIKSLEKVNEENCLIISSKIAIKLNLDQNNRINLQCGGKGISGLRVVVSETDLGDETFQLSDTILKELFIPENIKLSVNLIGDTLKLGPIIGVLSDNILIEEHKKGNSIRENFNCYVEAGNNIGGLVYIFSLRKIDLENKRVMGYLPLINKSGDLTWSEQWVPVPDGIHNRIKISINNIGYKKLVEMAKINPFLNIMNRKTKVYKWRVQKILEKSRGVKKYLPKTLLFSGINTLNRMLKQFNCVYLKPVGRSLGLGIIRIEKNSSDEYTAKYRMNGEAYSIKGSLMGMMPKIKSLMGKRKYIVQECIPLARYKGNIFDLRVSVQKDETGTWSYTRWKVRVAAPDSIVTNISAGGSAVSVKSVMEAVFKEKAEEIMSEIKNASIAICRAIESGLSGTGDIGLDIGVTEKGKVYFIEANFREFRLNSGAAENYSDLQNTFRKPIYYLNYLYKQQF